MNQLFEMFGPGLVMLISLIGVLLGISVARPSVVGFMRRCKRENKPIPWIVLVFLAAPTVGAVYSFILMQRMFEVTLTPENEGILLNYSVGVGLITAIAMIVIGKLGEIACKNSDITEKSLNSHFIKIGAVNSIALFAMVFAMINLP